MASAPPAEDAALLPRLHAFADGHREAEILVAACLCELYCSV